MSEQKGNEEISLKELVNSAKELVGFLLSKWKIIIVAGVIGALLGLAYSYTRKPVYTATLTFALENDKTAGAGGMLSLASQFGFDLGGSGGGVFEGSNLYELFKSRTMVENTLLKPVIYNNTKMSLAEMYIQMNKWRDSWKENPKFSSIQFLPDTKRQGFTRVHDSILGVIYKQLASGSLTVEQKDKKISIITMEVRSGNELFSMFFCENLAKEVGLFYINTKTKKAKVNMEILQRQTDSIRKELNNAIGGLAVANDNTFNLNPAFNVRRIPSSKKQVDVQANTAILTELVKQSELAKVTLRRETPLIQVLDRPILPLEKKRFGKFKGIVLGGFLFGFFTVLYLVFKRVYNYVMDKK